MVRWRVTDEGVIRNRGGGNGVVRCDCRYALQAHTYTCACSGACCCAPSLRAPRVSRCSTSTRAARCAPSPSPPTTPHTRTLTETRPLSTCMLWCRQRRGRTKRGRGRSWAQTATGRPSDQPARWDAATHPRSLRPVMCAYVLYAVCTYKHVHIQIICCNM